MKRTNSYSTYLDNLDRNLNEYLVKRAPALPKAWKETIVKVTPWVTLIVLILALPLLLTVLGIGAAVAPLSFAGGLGAGLGYVVSMLLLAVAVVLEAIAFPGLKNRSIKGWRLVYYSTLLSALSSLFKFDLLGAIIGPLISLYILYQVKEYYK